jgi:hypothetical protein
MRRFFTPIYWAAAVPLVALVLWSAMGSLSRAFFLAVMLLPGVLFFKYFAPDISFRERRQGILHAIYFAGAVMLIEYLGVFFVYINVEYPFTEEPPSLVMNPVFLWLLLGALLSIEWFLKTRLGESASLQGQKFITFISERRKTTLDADTSLYIESRDDEVTVHTVDKTWPTRMKISQWENALDGERFVRVHRSFIVGRRHITRIDARAVWLGEDLPIEISRKYRDRLTTP